jgi:RNA polymerase sigma-70 factor (ECF subfamily)
MMQLIDGLVIPRASTAVSDAGPPGMRYTQALLNRNSAVTEPGEITRLLREARDSGANAEQRLFELLYRELRAMAAAFLAKERKDHTLQPTALVHEVFLRLGGEQNIDWQNRAHFLAVAARTMRRFLVDYARARTAGRRGGGKLWKVELEPGLMSVEARTEEILDIDAALERLSKIDERQVRIVELRFFAGLSERQIAESMGLSERTVKREWQVARAWLHGQLGAGTTTGGPEGREV